MSPAARALARRAGPLELVIVAGADAGDLGAVPGWVKLAEIEPAAVSVHVQAGRGPSTATITRAGRTTTQGAEVLARGLDHGLVAALEVLVPAHDLAALTHRVSAELARITALQAVVERMLAAPDERQATTALLAGVTAGSGLAFHRAALFVPGADGAFHGTRAVGPVDLEEAHRIWESIEADAVAFDVQVERAGTRSSLEERVQALRLAPRAAAAGGGVDHAAGDVIARALRGEVVVAAGPDSAPELAAITPAATFVVCRVAAGEHVLGLLFADRPFGDPAVDDETARALAAFLAHAALAWQTRRLLRETERLARRDPLTALWNRRALEEMLGTEVHGVGRTGGSVGLLLLDLDHFREVNAARGHPGGDALLRDAADVLVAVLGDSGHGARFGGDELAAILPGARAPDLARIASAIGAAATARGVSLSIGGALVPDDARDPSALVAAADARLYAAKAAGRGRAVVPGEDVPIVLAT